ncbi:LysR family transcriptional regulator [Chitinibacter sp. SCUT-21]|uniref:LysR family transcriptional regulator n=1 Tax=Chitinibacter sp. SCUT-21 TaxID=2970891 RepID=UPI0035A6888D
MAVDHNLNDLYAFACVARLRSFRKAAQHLQLTPSALSHTMSRLEEQLGVRLLQRSTRSVSATEAGEQLLAELSPALAQIGAALDGLNTRRSKSVGRLRLNIPRAASRLLIAPRLAQWLATYPEIQLEIVASDALVDIVAEGFDAGVRFGEQLAQDMVAVAVGEPVEFAMAASPSYLAQHGMPANAAALLQHQCLQIRFPSGSHCPWELQQDGRKLLLNTRGRVVMDDFDLLLEAAVAGAGVCYHYRDWLAPRVAAGQLQWVLPECNPPREFFQLYYPQQRHVSAPLRAWVDFFRATTR